MFGVEFVVSKVIFGLIKEIGLATLAKVASAASVTFDAVSTFSHALDAANHVRDTAVAANTVATVLGARHAMEVENLVLGVADQLVELGHETFTVNQNSSGLYVASRNLGDFSFSPAPKLAKLIAPTLDKRSAPTFRGREFPKFDK